MMKKVQCDQSVVSKLTFPIIDFPRTTLAPKHAQECLAKSARLILFLEEHLLSLTGCEIDLDQNV